ncbi:glutathione S-transferase 2 isoform X2 [Folsomia candida]|uniref:Glutathione S-transferase 2 n=1 Tax=Folsomia candida TaxID=158441 RepID=A0A226EMK7_FOLCA|nr:glutathione S-transferase 2 isoform X2 [Folsomia candida]OXA58367.1 Glutathione S-transferase 2 [Folsomia candida]
MAEEIRLIYFDIRGLVEPLRWMFKLSDTPFTDERIPLDAFSGSGKRNSLEDIMKRRRSIEKKAGGRSRFIAQFPILMVGDEFVITQPLTVMRYVARRYGFNGTNELEEARSDEIADLVYDIRLRATDYEGKCFKSATPDILRHTVFRDFRNEPDGPKKEKMRDELRNMWFPLYFQKFTDIYNASSGEWVTGDSLTYGDLILANFLDIAEDLVDPTCLDEFPKLKELKDKVLALPAIMEWKRTQALEKVESSTGE